MAVLPFGLNCGYGFIGVHDVCALSTDQHDIRVVVVVVVDVVLVVVVDVVLSRAWPAKILP
jgi:hypothetical protein